MKIKDDALERIADALELKYEVEPYIDVSGVIASDVKRIANAITVGLEITTKTLSNGTELNELIRIAEALETKLGVSRKMHVGNTTDEPLYRIANALEEGYETGYTPHDALTRIAIALELYYECDPILDMFGCIKDGLNRIADVMKTEQFLNVYYPMETEQFLNVYDPPVRLIIDTHNAEIEIGDTISYDSFDYSVERSSGKISPVGISEISFNPSASYTATGLGLQMFTATYEEEAEE